ncbi:hypothetical protein [Streptomyces globosus]|uniref:hypothetical protein n=1 Tax=Streptomyces globosus TaxID=68209 RepID=UPI003641D9C7
MVVVFVPPAEPFPALPLPPGRGGLGVLVMTGCAGVRLDHRSRSVSPIAFDRVVRPAPVEPFPVEVLPGLEP